MTIHNGFRPRIIRSLSVIAAIALIVSSAGCVHTPIAQPSETNFVLVEAKPNTDRKALSAQVRALFNAGKYEDLENLAGDLRRKKLMFPAGRWHLDYFYEFLSESENASDQEWHVRLALLEKWIKARPESITARLALANAMLWYAWKGRSSDWGSNVQDYQWKMFRERLAKAKQLLMDADKLQEKCPCWYGMMLTLALGQSWNMEEVDHVFNESIRKEPKYLSAYMNKAIILQPRWSGKEGEWQKFAKQSADKVGGPEGDKLYARMVWNQEWLAGTEYGADFHSGRLSWERTKKGFEQLIEEYPGDWGPTSEFCAFSVKAEDKAQAKRLFEKLGNRVILGIWPTTDKFKAARDWAMGW